MPTGESNAIVESGANASAGGGISLGKGAWDCDAKCAIPPEKEVSLVTLCTIIQ